MFAEKYGEVVLLSHGLSLFPTDAGVESSPISFLSIGPRTSRRERSCAFAPEHFSQLPFIHYSPQLWRYIKKNISLPIMVFLACLHTLALVPSPPPDLVRALLKWLPAPCCFASATFSRCGRITVGVRRRFNAHTFSEWACHTRLAAEGRVNRSERAPVYQSVQPCSPLLRGYKGRQSLPSKGLLLCQLLLNGCHRNRCYTLLQNSTNSAETM